MVSQEFPAGWTRWHDGSDGTLIVTFRPDVFDGQAFPAPCLPTITVKRERARGPRGRPAVRSERETAWTVELRLEPEVVVERFSRESREAAVETACELARAFANGEIAYRDAYEHPRAAYLDELDALIRTGEED